MQKLTRIMVLVAIVLACASIASADTFGTGENQFTIDFVTISGSVDDGYGGQSAGEGFTTSNIDHDYRMGVYEITNDQWTKFKNSLGVPVTGNPSSAYAEDPFWTGTNVPTNRVSWYEAAQFVNWLNTSTGHQAAYKFTGTQGKADYALATWSAAEADNGTNLYRHKDAMYYLPTEDEWVKAGYWNGTSLQTYTTKPGETLHQGDGTNGTGWNYYLRLHGYATDPSGPWGVGSGSEELNGTYDMMGNVWEWMESPYRDPNYGIGSERGLRGASFNIGDYNLMSSFRYDHDPDVEYFDLGFRVASNVPEPATLILSLDILPGSGRNPFMPNKKSKGRLPMAILATEEVAADDIDLDSIKIEGVVSPIKTSTDKDIDGDGLIDLVMHFSRRALIDALSLDTYEIGAEVEIAVNAIRLSDGTPIEATDSIVIVGPNH